MNDSKAVVTARPRLDDCAYCAGKITPYTRASLEENFHSPCDVCDKAEQSYPVPFCDLCRHSRPRHGFHCDGHGANHGRFIRRPKPATNCVLCNWLYEFASERDRVLGFSDGMPLRTIEDRYEVTERPKDFKTVRYSPLLSRLTHYNGISDDTLEWLGKRVTRSRVTSGLPK